MITSQPQSGTRFVGAPGGFSFSVSADGGRPLRYQWKHIFGEVTNALAGETNQTLVVTNLQTSDAGDYFATVSNLAGSTNSQAATLDIMVPTPGSYAETVLSKGPYAYWALNETNGTNLHDYWGGHHGVIIDPAHYATNTGTYEDPPGVTNYYTNIVEAGVWLGDPGVAAAGFPQDHSAMRMPNNDYPARANLSSFPSYTNGMMWCCWVYTPGVAGAGSYPGNDQGPAFLLNRDRDNNGGYGNAFGLCLFPHYTGDTNNAQNQLGYKWGGGTENPAEPFNGYRFTNSTLYLP